MNLQLDWCSYKAAKYSVENWHYSKSLPAADLVKIGVWENKVFKGVVLFGRGASPYLGKRYGLGKGQWCELVRVALKEHENPITKILSFSLSLLKRNFPNIKLVISFADPNQKHLGKIYQAGNWIYTGQTDSSPEWFFRGRWMHTRQIGSLGYSTKDWNSDRKRMRLGKFRYLYPLTKQMRKQIESLAKPYPKKLCDVGVNRSTTSFQDVGGGAIPTTSLHLERQYIH